MRAPRGPAGSLGAARPSAPAPRPLRRPGRPLAVAEPSPTSRLPFRRSWLGIALRRSESATIQGDDHRSNRGARFRRVWACPDNDQQTGWKRSTGRGGRPPRSRTGAPRRTSETAVHRTRGRRHGDSLLRLRPHHLHMRSTCQRGQPAGRGLPRKSPTLDGHSQARGPQPASERRTRSSRPTATASEQVKAQPGTLRRRRQRATLRHVKPLQRQH